MDDFDKVTPPHSLDAERALLGCLLIDTRTIDKVQSLVSEDAFYSKANAKVYAAILAVHRRGVPPDVAVVREELVAMKVDPDISDVQTLNFLTDAAPNPGNAEHHALTVAEHALRRALCDEANSTLLRACDAATPVTAALRASQDNIMKLALPGETNVMCASDMFMDAWDNLEARISPDSNACIKTQFHDLDDFMGGGVYRQTLTIIAARPSQGKTALLVNILGKMALHSNVNTLFYSVEVSASRVGLNLMCAYAKINTQRFRPGEVLSGEETDRLISASAHLKDHSFHIVGTGSWEIHDLVADARRTIREKNISVVAIDYLQLLSCRGIKNNNALEISTVSAMLKALAKDSNVAVIAVAQLNREVEHRGDRRPKLSDLKGSGGIEQDADIVMANFWEDYNAQARGVETKRTHSDGWTEMDVMFLKQRDGPCGTVTLLFMPCWTRFENFHRRPLPQGQAPPPSPGWQGKY